MIGMSRKEKGAAKPLFSLARRTQCDDDDCDKNDKDDEFDEHGGGRYGSALILPWRSDKGT
jgi:hypothetical protein